MWAGVEGTAGAQLAAGLRYYLSVGTRTRRHRFRGGQPQDLHREMIDAIMMAAQYPGAHGPAVEAALRPGFGAALSYGKHVAGHRIDGVLAQRINAMSPWRFAALLGDMVDAEVTCTGDGERFFADMARRMRQAEAGR